MPTRPSLVRRLADLLVAAMLAVPLAVPLAVATGAPAAAAPDLTRGQAYVVAWRYDGPTVIERSWHSRGGSITVVADGAGRWRVTIGGLSGLGGNVQLTQHIETGEGQHTTGYCNIESWGPASGSTVVYVRCWDPTGAPATRAAFGVLFNNSTVMPSSAYAAFWNGQGTFSGTVNPNPTYVMGATPRLTRTAVGRYTVEYSGAITNPFPLATAWGKVPRVCNIVDWYTTPALTWALPTTLIRVACFDFAGKPADSGFSFQLSSRSPLGVDGTTGGKVFAATPGSQAVTPTTNNVNTRFGPSQPVNSYTGMLFRLPWSTNTGTFVSKGVDTLAAVGADGARCFVELPGLETNGDRLILVVCYSPGGQLITHAAHTGSWSL